MRTGWTASQDEGLFLQLQLKVACRALRKVTRYLAVPASRGVCRDKAELPTVRSYQSC